LVVVGEGIEVIEGGSRLIPWDASEIIDRGKRSAIFAEDFYGW
jgi:hypothetical protein